MTEPAPETKLTIPEIVAHLANLTFIFDHHERLGTSKNPLLVAEFHHWNSVLLKRMESELETRKRTVDA